MVKMTVSNIHHLYHKATLFFRKLQVITLIYLRELKLLNGSAVKYLLNF